MFDHFSIPVSDVEKSKNFYDKTFEILSLVNFADNTFIGRDGEKRRVIMYGSKPGNPTFIIGGFQDKAVSLSIDLYKLSNFHISFKANNITEIQQWHTIGLQSGGTDNGKPGSRDYSPGYYAAFLFDPDGWHLEVNLHNYKG